MYGNHLDYLLRECDVLDFDPETSTITVIVRVAEKTLMCSAADPEDVNLIWTS
ncbi:hypothetical protein FGIG_01758 [Fasciola gigantica]|uniref:Uncharacterized protein n=1 Tax=Fasciola gigantica TaxID=46835 RepID=A0A504Y7F2_FASGI|nr:hypothetical protein FGIG_01758 [Fasciola gigantica]